MAFQYVTVNSNGMSTHYHARSLRNSKQFTNLAFQIVQDSDIINSDPKEFYAYSVETAMGGVANSLAMEILRLTMEEVINAKFITSKILR